MTEIKELLFELGVPTRLVNLARLSSQELKEILELSKGNVDEIIEELNSHIPEHLTSEFRTESNGGVQDVVDYIANNKNPWANSELFDTSDW